MTIKPSSIFGSNETETKFTGNYVKEKKSPDSMFMEPVHIGQCPLCGGNVYSENDPSNDHTMARKCCKCTWNDNQFMTWEEMSETIEEFKKGDPDTNKNLCVVDEFYNVYGETRDPNILRDVISKSQTTIHPSKGFVENFLVNELSESGVNVNIIDLSKENEFKPISEVNSLLFGLSELKDLVNDDSVCFLCKCVAYDGCKTRWERIEVLGFSVSLDKPRNVNNVRYMYMDLEELSMMEQSGIKIIIARDFVNQITSLSIQLSDFYNELHKELKSNSREDQFEITSGRNKHGDSSVNLQLTKEFETFFSQGLISNLNGDLVIMCNNSTTHFFIVKFDGKELRTIKLYEIGDLDGLSFCYNDKTNSLEFNCSCDNDKDLVKVFRDVLLVFKEDLLRALKYMNTQLELFGNEFQKLVLSEEREVYLGYTEKVFLDKYSLGKVMIIPCEHASYRTEIIPRVSYEGRWVLKLEYGRNQQVRFK